MPDPSELSTSDRAFVLAPWLDVDPGAELPGRGSVDDLLRVVGMSGVRRLDDVGVRAPR